MSEWVPRDYKTTDWVPGDPIYGTWSGRHGSVLTAREMVQIMDDFGAEHLGAEPLPGDAARWPEPFLKHDLDQWDENVVFRRRMA